jgi:hypothetical protein
MSQKVAFIAHCLLNQNAKVEGGAKRPGMWEPVIDLLRERGYVIRQMPCPELAFGGARRFWGVREQFDTPVSRGAEGGAGATRPTRPAVDRDQALVRRLRPGRGTATARGNPQLSDDPRGRGVRCGRGSAGLQPL